MIFLVSLVPTKAAPPRAAWRVCSAEGFWCARGGGASQVAVTGLKLMVALGLSVLLLPLMIIEGSPRSRHQQQKDLLITPACASATASPCPVLHSCNIAPTRSPIDERWFQRQRFNSSFDSDSDPWVSFVAGICRVVLWHCRSGSIPQPLVGINITYDAAMMLWYVERMHGLSAGSD